MSNVSTKVVKIDLKTILENYRNPEFWDKEWLVIDLPQCKITWKMTDINIKSHAIESELHISAIEITRGNKKISSLSDTYYLSKIPLKHEDYTEEFFNKSLLRGIIQLLNGSEHYMTMDYEEYLLAEKADYAKQEEAEKLAKEILDEENVYNEKIRRAYIEKCIEEVDSFEERNKVVNNFRGKIIPNLYLYAAAWFDDEEVYEEWAKKTSEERKSSYYSLRKIIKEIQTPEWRNAMKEELSKSL